MKRACPTALLLALATLGLAFAPFATAQEESADGPWTAIEKAAKASALTNLAHHVSAHVFDYDELSAASLAGIDDRLIRHEQLYRQNPTLAVPEINVVRAVNAMLDRFGAPGYADTDAYEVRRLELAMLGEIPSLIAREPAGSKEAKTKTTINPTLSPIEALLVAGELLHQKETNGEFLFTFAEQVARWSAVQSGAAVAPADARVEETQAAAQNGALAMNPSALLDLPNQLLNDLGIQP